MTTNFTKTAGYIRVSTDKQDFERQRGEIIRYAERNDFTVVKIFEDKQTGSDYENRIGFQDLLIFLEENQDVKVIIFDEVSRMGRDTAQQVATYKQLVKKGVKIFTVGKGEFGCNKEDTLLFTVLSAIAEYEKQTIIDRTSSGRRKVVRDGATQISHRPFGYNIILTEKKQNQVLKRQFIRINEREAEAVRGIYKIIDEGGTLIRAIQYLNRSGVKPVKSSKWARSSVLRMLHNTIYFGEWQFGKFYKNGKTKYSVSKRPLEQLLVVKVPAIISREVYDRVQSRLTVQKNKFNPRNQKSDFLLKGLCRCHCGRVITCVTDIRSKHRLYRCPQRNQLDVEKKTCPIKSVKADFLEKVLLIELEKKISNPKFCRELKLSRIEGQKRDLEVSQSRIDAIKQQILAKEELMKVYYEKAAKTALENPAKAAVHEKLADSYIVDVRTLKKEMADLEVDLKHQETSQVDVTMLQDIKKALKYVTRKELEAFSTSTQKIEFVRKYIKNIQLEYRMLETKKLHKKISSLKRLGIYKKENADIRPLFFTIANSDQKPLNNPLYILRIGVTFVNNLVVNIDIPYFHKRPEIASSYLVNKKFRSL